MTMPAALHGRMSEVEHLADDLNRLLARYGSTLEHAGVRHQVEELARLTECYRHGLHYGLLVADKIHEDEWLTGLRNRLKLEARELGRLENEGGPTGAAAGEVSDDHADTDDFLGAVQQANAIISRAENLFFALPKTQPESGR